MNTIHIVLDTLKWNACGCYGNNTIKTPNIDKLAEKSTVFWNAHCSSFPCMPARRDFFTGRYEFPFRGWGPLEESDVTIIDLLKKQNKITSLVTDHYHLFREGAGNYHFAFDSWQFIRGLCDDRLYTDKEDDLDIDFQCSEDKLSAGMRQYYYKFRAVEMKEEKDYPTARTFSTATDWLKRNYNHGDGFHLLIDSFPPHEPFDPPMEYSDAYDPGYTGNRIIAPRYGDIAGFYTDAEVKHINALYAGNITFVDKWIGYFLDTLENLGCMQNTAIIITADHGYCTGEHGRTGKNGTYMYDIVSHVPLIVYHPKHGGGRCDAMVSNCDVAPTIADICGIDYDGFQGKSLLPLIEKNSDTIRKYTHSGFFGIMQVINDGRYAYHAIADHDMPLYWFGMHDSKFVSAGTLGSIEVENDVIRRKVTPDFARRFNFKNALYDLENDPEQKINLIDKLPEKRVEFEQEFYRFCKEIFAPQEHIDRYAIKFLNKGARDEH